MNEEGKGLSAKPDRTDILAFIIAFWQLFLPMILVFLFLFVVAILLMILLG
jgi:uncharacterized integral membrane protein